jgi:putative protease
MKKMTYIKTLDELQCLHSETEIILEHKDLARIGTLTSESVVELYEAAKQKGHKVHLEWDVLMTQQSFQRALNIFKEIGDLDFNSIRVQDPGAIHFIKNQTSYALTLNLETGNHNLRGILSWIEMVGLERIDRIILSIELSKSKLKHYIEQIPVPIEFQVLGRILLFYTPRNLLSALTEETDDKRTKRQVSKDFISAIGESEESPHKGFPLVENRHGTFMFHIKNLYLLDSIQDIVDAGLAYGRYDLRDVDFSFMQTIEKLSDPKQVKEFYPKDTTKGYFNINKSNVLFKKLKNYRIQRKDQGYIGEVVDAVKGSYMAVAIKAGEVSIGDSLKLITPEGKEYSNVPVVELKNSAGEKQDSIEAGQLAIINYVGGALSRTAIYHQ